LNGSQNVGLMCDIRESSASVFVTPASLHKGGNITGEIWLEVAGFEFPEMHWSDFPVIILDWWLDALFKLWSEKKRRGECLFMDGSYSFEVSKEEDAFVLRCFSDTHSTKKCEWEGVIDLTELLRQVLSTASVLLKECRGRGWTTADTEVLESKWVLMDGVLNPQSA
jgi:hypothetical protein